MAIILISVGMLASISIFCSYVLYKKNIQIWIGSYIRQKIAKAFASRPTDTPIHIYVCLADHWEPYNGGADKKVAHARVSRWLTEFPKVASGHLDSDGRPPQHSYFYPEEEYDEWILAQLASLCKDGYGDVEIHLHHDNDTSDNLRATLGRFKSVLHERHGLLRKNSRGEIVYGFIHGNWALDNSRPDGRWCGVNDEIQVLLETGCIFDMTMPSAPSNTQTSTINSIYLVREDGYPKSHDKGTQLTIDSRISKDQLLMIQGPLCLDWTNRKFGLLPRIEAAELSMDAPPSRSRAKLWESCNIKVHGIDNQLFIKLHCHGLEDSAGEMFFEQGGFEKLWTILEAEFRDREGYLLHYVTAYEMYQQITSLVELQPTTPNGTE